MPVLSGNTLMTTEKNQDQETLSFWQVMASTIAAAFGVQKGKNRERDFSKGKPVHFIVAGLIFTVVFVLAVITVVQVVLSNT
jgi:amino acid permease